MMPGEGGKMPQEMYYQGGMVGPGYPGAAMGQPPRYHTMMMRHQMMQQSQGMMARPPPPEYKYVARIDLGTLVSGQN